MKRLGYETRTDFTPDGVITECRIYARPDGKQFTLAASGIWEADYSRKTLVFPAVPGARYVRLEAVDGTGGCAASVDIQVCYE
ncbi:hypothetical protein [Paenibacillus senegalensis]|uniref:hypothetical protein n=1 Tax=Paenibacillus senegalensis TaxID=1465766 RepID=UPI0003056ABC|nr:hypothetical protein [Paenibacillus senegalensis]